MRILLECTDSQRSDAHTGIQRVVRNLLDQAARHPLGPGVECIPVMFRRGSFRRCKPAWKPSLLRRYKAFLRSTYLRLLRWQRPLQRTPGWEVIARNAVAWAKALALGPVEWLEQRPGRPLSVHPGDVIVMLDASWNEVPAFWDAIGQLKAGGVAVLVVVYDFIPLTHPRTLPWQLVRNFRAWVDHLREQADGLLCISAATREAVLRELRRPGNAHALTDDRVRTFPLGFALDRKRGSVRPEVRQLARRPIERRPYLMVGTFEPRKNHAFVLDAFESLWARHPEAELWMAGATGWLTEGLMERLREHPRLGRQLRVFHNLTDQELDVAYRHAKALISASEVEGCGLPVVEALARGCPVLASDIAPFHEVAGDHASYFPLTSPHALTRLLDALEQSGVPARVAPYQGPDWPQSAAHLLREVVALTRAEPPKARAGDSAEAAAKIAALEQRVRELEQLVNASTAQQPVVIPTTAPRPRVTVVMPVYNRPGPVVEAIQSVQRQSRSDWELVVVDDGSTDGTRAAVQALLDDPRIRLYHQDNGGAPSARNVALHHGRGDLVTYLDSDNLWYPDYLAHVVAAYDADPALESAYGILVSDEHGWISHGQVNQPFDREMMLDGQMIIDINVYSHRRALYEAHGGFDPALIRVDDWDLILRYTERTPPKQLNIPATQYRRVDAQAMTVSQPYGPDRFRVRSKWLQPKPLPRPLRVLYVLDNYPKLSETYVETELRCMLRWGVAVEAWSSKPGRSPHPPTVPVHRGSLADAIRAVQPDLLHVHWLGMAAPDAAELAASGLPVTVRTHGFDAGVHMGQLVRDVPTVRKVFCFPHEAGRAGADARLHPVPAGFDTALFHSERNKDRRMVIRAAPGLPDKHLELFVEVARQLPEFRFVLALASVRNFEGVIEKARRLWAEVGLPGEVLVDVPRDRMAALVHQAGIKLFTAHPPTSGLGYPLGMPMSLAESMATGAYLLIPDFRPYVDYVGPAGRTYRDAQHAAQLIAETATWTEAQWKEAWTYSVDTAFVHYADEVAYRPIYDAWRDIVLGQRGSSRNQTAAAD